MLAAACRSFSERVAVDAGCALAAAAGRWRIWIMVPPRGDDQCADDEDDRRLADQLPRQIGRASCRERVCQYVSISVVAVSLTQKITKSPISSHNRPTHTS